MTVRRIVRASEVQAYVQDLRAAYYGLGQEAVEALRRSLRSTKDGNAYQLLADIGVVPDQEERQRSRTVRTQEDEDRETRVWIVKLYIVRYSVASHMGCQLMSSRKTSSN